MLGNMKRQCGWSGMNIREERSRWCERYGGLGSLGCGSYCEEFGFYSETEKPGRVVSRGIDLKIYS